MTRSTGMAFASALALLGFTPPAVSGEMIPAEGRFTVSIDFSTLTLTPMGANCILEVEGAAEFTGTLQGIAPGKTRAVVLAPCAEVAATPPGGYQDMFSSDLEFAGTVNGAPAIADITYRGNTAIGGAIAATMRPSNGLRGVLKVDAIVAVGGSYTGFIKAE